MREKAVTPQEAAAREALFLDVREPYEWAAGHISGALHIPIGQIQARIGEVDRDRQVIVVCQIGQRSALVADFLDAQGYDAYNLEGGLEAWTAGGLPLDNDDSSGKLVDGWARGMDGRRLDGTDDAQ